MSKYIEIFRLRHLRLIRRRYKEPKRSWFRSRVILSPPLTRYHSSIMGAPQRPSRRRKKLQRVMIMLACLLLLLAGGGIAFYAQSLQSSHASTVSGRKAPVMPTPSANSSPAVAVPLSIPPVFQGAIISDQWAAISSTQVVYIDTAMHIDYLSSLDGTHWKLTDLTQMTHAPLAGGSALAAYQWSQVGTQQIVYIDARQHINLLRSGTDGGWQHIDLTQLTGSPISNGVALSAYEWLQFGTEQVIYIDGQQHVHELESFDGVRWNNTDLTKVTAAPLAEGTQVRGFSWTAGNSKQVIYIDVNEHIQDLSQVGGGHWQRQDLTRVTSAPLANGNALTGYEWHITSTEIIDYIDQNNAIQELTSSPAGKWTLTDVTRVAGGPITNGQALTGFEWLTGGERDIAYVDNQVGNQGDIIQLSLKPGEQWQVTDVQQQVKAPLTEGTTLLGVVWQSPGSKQLIYVDVEQHVQELIIAPQGRWHLVTMLK